MEHYVIDPGLNFCLSGYVQRYAESSLAEASGMEVSIGHVDLSIRHIAVYKFQMGNDLCTESPCPIVRADRLESDFSILNLFFGEMIHLKNITVDRLAVNLGSDLINNSLSAWMYPDPTATPEESAPFQITGLKLIEPTISLGYEPLTSKFQPGEYQIEENITTDSHDMLSRLAWFSAGAAGYAPFQALGNFAAGTMGWLYSGLPIESMDA